MTEYLKIGRHDVKVTSPDKVLFPNRDRPLALQAFPAGIDGKGFFLKEVQDHFPDWVGRVTVPKRGGTPK